MGVKIGCFPLILLRLNPWEERVTVLIAVCHTGFFIVRNVQIINMVALHTNTFIIGLFDGWLLKLHKAFSCCIIRYFSATWGQINSALNKLRKCISLKYLFTRDGNVQLLLIGWSFSWLVNLLFCRKNYGKCSSHFSTAKGDVLFCPIKSLKC